VSFFDVNCHGIFFFELSLFFFFFFLHLLFFIINEVFVFNNSDSFIARTSTDDLSFSKDCFSRTLVPSSFFFGLEDTSHSIISSIFNSKDILELLRYVVYFIVSMDLIHLHFLDLILIWEGFLYSVRILIMGSFGDDIFSGFRIFFFKHSSVEIIIVFVHIF